MENLHQFIELMLYMLISFLILSNNLLNHTFFHTISYSQNTNYKKVYINDTFIAIVYKKTFIVLFYGIIGKKKS